MKYNSKVDKYNSKDSFNGLYYVTIIRNSNRTEQLDNFYNNGQISKIIKKSFKKLCINPIFKGREIWFRSYKDAFKTKIKIDCILNN